MADLLGFARIGKRVCSRWEVGNNRKTAVGEFAISSSEIYPARFRMEALVQMFGGAATLIAVLGGAMATIFFAWAGIQWMMASGDPQKIGQARMALIGAAIGLVIVGAAFIVPEVISERIIEPAGGTAIENTAGLSCDRVLKNQIVFSAGGVQ